MIDELRVQACLWSPLLHLLQVVAHMVIKGYLQLDFGGLLVSHV